MRWKQDLKGIAYEIASSDADILRVQAGPGTGKTFAIIRRVARLLEEGVEPSQILVCTLTRTAATDLVRQVCALGMPQAFEVKVGTLHSFCLGLLGKAAVFKITHRNPRLLLPFEEKFLIEDIKHSKFGGANGCKKCLKRFGAGWAKLHSDDPGWPKENTDKEFHKALMAWLVFHEGMLVDEILPLALQYLRDNPAAPEQLAFDHVLVDEYQDLNRADQVLLDILANEGTLSVVGDKNQSIYSFRYAHPEGIGNFEKVHPGTVDYNLDECRRCPKRVVEIANSLISNNKTRWAKYLKPRKENRDGEIYVIQWPTIEDEAAGLAHFIKHAITNLNITHGNVLVLAPRKQLGFAIQDALNSNGVEARSFFSDSILDANPKKADECEAQAAISLINLLVNPDDRVALRCWCGLGHNTLRTTEWKRISIYCKKSNLSPIEVLRSISANKIYVSNTAGIVARFKLLEKRLKELHSKKGVSLLDALLPSDCEWAKELRVIGQNLKPADYDAATLLDALKTSIIQPELPTEVNYVRVMSLHKAKGLSASLVIVAGCTETLIPHIDFKLTYEEQEESLEEQRRLFYVSITRTTNILILSNAVMMERQSAHRMRAQVGFGDAERGRTVSSRFLGELGPTCPKAIRGNIWLEKMLNGE